MTFNIKHQPSVPVGQLWVELLRFYALEFNLADLVISIRVKELISRESKDWPKKRIAIEGNNVWLRSRGAGLTAHFYHVLLQFLAEVGLAGGKIDTGLLHAVHWGEGQQAYSPQGTGS